jgi:pyroglutamyl-peptidase
MLTAQGKVSENLIARAKVRVLLTGFEAFAGDAVNPSWVVASALAQTPPADCVVTALEAPVDPAKAFDVVRPSLLSGEFDAWVGLGLAGGRPFLSVERIGINIVTDEAGVNEAPISIGAVDAYFANVPPGEVVSAIRTAGIPAIVSNTAGTYICNQLLYLVAREVSESHLNLLTTFVHLPFLPEQAVAKPGAPSMGLDTQIAGVRAVLGAVSGYGSQRGIGLGVR